MALFFDANWFDQRLRLLGLGRASIAATLGIADDEVEALFKDQRELKPTEVVTLAALLAVPVAELAQRAGAGTVAPETAPEGPFEARLEAVEQAMQRLEERMSRVESLLARATEATRSLRADLPSRGS
ncbi:hypothetical protein L2U69_01565 [Zavarzinia compransoris]|uniref:hypothetical protein n=1 Tax=Zavarzinia marina TaxID=2911065 RepID=UPI001F21E569|nr:hypothetical protein [Zavarzinia marina]MCF4164333.1 hypothetical protein [Zavarzinia marina]